MGMYKLEFPLMKPMSNYTNSSMGNGPINVILHNPSCEFNSTKITIL